MPRKKSSGPSRPIKGTWESFAKANALGERQPTVRLELTVSVVSTVSSNNNTKKKKPAKVFTTKRKFTKIEEGE